MFDSSAGSVRHCRGRWPVLISIFIVFAFQAVLPVWLRAQQIADTVQLDEVRVQATRIEQPMRYQPTSVAVVDSMELALSSGQDLGAILSQQQGLYVSNYGPGAASTLSQRGLSATETQVLWDGIPINHPMLGQVDFSILPAGMFSQVEVSSGTGSSAYGGGSVGGAVYLEPARVKQHLAIKQSAGMFGRYRTSVEAGLQQGDWDISLLGQHHDEANDFEYYDPIQREQRTRRHNSSAGNQMMFSAGHEGATTDIRTTFWWSSVQHEVPGSIVSASGHSSQDDRSLRWLTAVDGRVAGWQSELKLYGSRFSLDYTDPVTGIYSESVSWESRTELNLRRYLSDQWTWKGNLAAGYTTIETNNYNGRPERYLFSVRLAPEWHPAGLLRLYPAIRVDSYSDFGTIVSPSLGFNMGLGPDELRLRGQAGWNYNPPTFNDLYWTPGGNPELKPERSFKVEGGIISDGAVPVLGRQELTTYWIRMRDGIEWMPGERAIWHPRNLKVLRAYGLEWNMRRKLQPGLGVVVVQQNASWSRSELAESRFAGDQAVNKQRAYVPEWQYKGGLRWVYSSFIASAQLQWVGQRYTTEDHQSSLEPYTLFNATLAYRHDIDTSFEMQVTLELRNLLDTEYQVIQWYPMPGRNGLISLKIGWK